MLTGNTNNEGTVREVPRRRRDRLLVFVRIKRLGCLETSEIIEQSTQLNIPDYILTYYFVKNIKDYDRVVIGVIAENF